MNIHALKRTFTCGIYINKYQYKYHNIYKRIPKNPKKQTNKTSSTIFGYLINGDEENEFQLHGFLLRPSTTCPATPHPRNQRLPRTWMDSVIRSKTWHTGRILRGNPLRPHEMDNKWPHLPVRETKKLVVSQCLVGPVVPSVKKTHRVFGGWNIESRRM